MTGDKEAVEICQREEHKQYLLDLLNIQIKVHLYIG